MLGLSALGLVHTAISLVALAAGVASLVRWRLISPRSRLGQIYIWTTVLTCLTAFGIFRHGGFNKAHALGIVTLGVLALAWLSGTPRFFGRAARYIEAASYTFTLFLHLVPGITETSTRLPAGSPLFANPDDPSLQKLIGATLAVFLVLMVAQALHLRALSRQPAAPADVAEAGHPAATLRSGRGS